MTIIMDRLKGIIKSYISRPFKAKRDSLTLDSEYYCRNTLPGLPTELLLQICEALKPVDLVCLCLCNNQLHMIFRRYYRLSSLRKDKLSILSRLERDLPEYFACDICTILHKYDGSESFGLSGMVHKRSCPLPCVRKGYKLAGDYFGGSSMSLRTHCTFSHAMNRISFLQIKLAMRRFRYGSHSGINTESLSYVQVRCYPHPLEVSPLEYPTIDTLFSIQAQICSKPLGVYIRMQDIVLFGIWEDSKIDSPSNPLSLYEICDHTSLQSKAFALDFVYEGFKEFLAYTCRKCNTESLIEIRRLGSRVALIMTRWVNLGTGQDREDPLWKIHTFDPKNPPAALDDSLTTQSPRACFEDMTSLSFEDLRSRNLSYLRDRDYKKGKPFVREGKNYYHISYKEPSKKRRVSFPRPRRNKEFYCYALDEVIG